MWIAKQGVKAPLPRGWKAIHDLEQNELYYFNFDTGESIWDHPCDNDFKELVIEQRLIRAIFINIISLIWIGLPNGYPK